MVAQGDDKLDIDKLAARLREMHAAPTINRDEPDQAMGDFLGHLNVADDLPVIDLEENTSLQDGRKTCAKCGKGKLRRHSRNLIEKTTFVKKKFLCDYCADGVYIRRFNGN